MAEEIKNETVEEVVNEEVDTQETTEQQEEIWERVNEMIYVGAVLAGIGIGSMVNFFFGA